MGVVVMIIIGIRVVVAVIIIIIIIITIITIIGLIKLLSLILHYCVVLLCGFLISLSLSSH